MLLRILDRFEEILISFLMALAVVLIFIAVVHRFSIGFAADLVGYARANDLPGLQDWARSIFKSINAIKLTWAQEACIYLFVWMAKFGAAYGVRIGIHVGVDILAERLEGAARKTITVIAMSGGILFTFIIAWIGTDFVWHVYKGGQTSPDLELKMWIIYLAVPLGSALMCFRFVQALWLFLTTGEIAHHDLGSVEGIEEEAEAASEGKS
ncbi:TRAP transporter small permease [Paracoccus spongiarum]|uniref:TRAP transporter small permease protein n=1 Tax=Paracoccus spongiarum TaxID=3064387 RepID=A0ABT9J7R5_9RHOB|nr:TRAP transporter small permease [Paracoccus sp. 2205BS29-5]MDP5305834.1 TRAP transporter small permease [Paracoccus sp. 2205BS29-5]